MTFILKNFKKSHQLRVLVWVPPGAVSETRIRGQVVLGGGSPRKYPEKSKKGELEGRCLSGWGGGGDKQHLHQWYLTCSCAAMGFLPSRSPSPSSFSVSWNHLPNQLLAFDSPCQGLLLADTDMSETWHEIWPGSTGHPARAAQPAVQPGVAMSPWGHSISEAGMPPPSVHLCPHGPEGKRPG